MSRPLAKWLILIALLAYAVLMAAFADSAVRHRTGSDIEIIIDSEDTAAVSFLTPGAVKRELGSLPARFSRMPLSAIDTDSLERMLACVNNFEHVEVVRTGTGKLLVKVVPMIPEARIFSSTGTYYINKDGKRLDAHAEYFADLPVVRGNFTRRMPASGVLPVTRHIASDTYHGGIPLAVKHNTHTALTRTCHQSGRHHTSGRKICKPLTHVPQGDAIQGL